MAETRMEKTLKLEPGGQFTLDTELGKVTVRGTRAGSAFAIARLCFIDKTMPRLP